MNMIHLLLLLSSVLCSTFSERANRFYDGEEERGNEFIDMLLEDMIHDHGTEYDPYQLEDSSMGFSKKIMFVNVSGEAKLYNGYIMGLRTLHRPHNCVVNEEGDKLVVTTDLGAGVIKCHYDGTVKFMNFGPTVQIVATINYVEIHMEFKVDKKTGNNGQLQEFNIDDMKGMKVEITGLGPMNWATNYLISGATTLFQGFIKRMLEKQVRSHIAERLPNYQFPVDDVITDAPK